MARWAAYKQVDFLNAKLARLEQHKKRLLGCCKKADLLFAHAVGSQGSTDPANAERNFQEAKKLLEHFRRVVRSTEEKR